jgi:hypothetical protein
MAGAGKDSHMTTESIGMFYDASRKMGEAREELLRSATKADHEGAREIFEAMCAANVQHTRTAETIRQLAMASLLYADAVLRHDMAAQATARM